MKRILCAVLAVLLCLCVLSGCKKDVSEETTTLTENETTSESATLTQEQTTVDEITSAAEMTTAEAVTEKESESASVEVLTSAEATTVQEGERPSEEETTKKEATQNTDKPFSNEYDILRSGNFYITGSMVDSSGIDSPLEMAVTDNSVYMLSEFSAGVDIAMLVSDGNVYMIYPDKAAYLEVNDSIMSMMGLTVEDMIGDGAVDFSTFGSIDDAYKTGEAVSGGQKCTVYHIKEDDGEMRVYMNGDKLIRFASYSQDGKFLSATDVKTITHNVPASKKAPPADYKSYSGVSGMFTFMSFFADFT